MLGQTSFLFGREFRRNEVLCLVILATSLQLLVALEICGAFARPLLKPIRSYSQSVHRR